MSALARTSCANGDGNPICPPSKVICRECMDRISEKLERWAAHGRFAYETEDQRAERLAKGGA